MENPRLAMAVELFRQAYQLQMQGELDLAVSLYKRSLDLHPTAEAYTYHDTTLRTHAEDIGFMLRNRLRGRLPHRRRL